MSDYRLNVVVLVKFLKDSKNILKKVSQIMDLSRSSIRLLNCKGVNSFYLIDLKEKE